MSWDKKPVKAQETEEPEVEEPDTEEENGEEAEEDEEEEEPEEEAGSTMHDAVDVLRNINEQAVESTQGLMDALEEIDNKLEAIIDRMADIHSEVKLANKPISQLAEMHEPKKHSKPRLPVKGRKR